MHLRLGDTFALGEGAEHATQVALDVLDALAGHSANVQVEIAIVRIARQSPRRPAADRGDRHVGVLAHVFMLGFVIACPLRDIALQFVHHGYRVDHVRPIGERGMRDSAAHGDAQPDDAHVCDRDLEAGRLGQ